MKKSRVEIKCGIFATIIVIAAVFSVMLLTGTGQYVPRTSDYSAYELAVNPPMPDFSYPLANYSLVRGGMTFDIFERIGIENYESGIEFYEGLTNMTHRDRYGRLDIHETPTTVIQYHALEQNTLKFELAQGTGAIKRGNSIIVGSEDVSGIFVMLDGSTANIAGQEVLFSLPSGSGVVFRTDTGIDSPVGTAVAEGRVSAEMYLLDAGWTVGEDVVSYGDTWLYAVTASEEIVEVQVTGNATGKSVVIHVTEPYLKYVSADDMTVKLDGVDLKSGLGMAETLWDTGEEASYFAVKTANGYDVIVYIPENSDSVITITTADANFGVDGLITLLAAIGIVGVAVVALIKTE
ncbi:MAG: hypothetical protein KKH41_01875 [Candidatus Thermoplasmatota archaeon]|nr:hypothetical protein [Euryarchaeota archaeon]MBU4032310.1 hypothetical protein [Candidatus Thermoplasmatota archaeon]MBU4071107.1 hypothetical protein [Candidatus Thermoplasmatota archaeon]MBU4143649.1 hypothetical protein [Candidatus Thermoplasmatota archaeon]MBU4591309.1 hypothetical protein [Candidatus Thermoplasmatota archaeon]